MSYSIKTQSVHVVESVETYSLNIIRMLQLKSKPAPTPIPTRISQRKLKAIRLESQSLPAHSPGRYCILPPAPTPNEAAELLSLELQMGSIPLLAEVIVDDIEALAMVTEVDVETAVDAQRESGTFDEEEPKSGNEAITIIPR